MSSAEFLNRFLTHTLESSIMLIVFYLLYYLLLRKESNFGFNRYYLLLSPILAVVLPMLSLPSLFPGGTTPEVLNPSLTLPQVEIALMINPNYFEQGPVLMAVIIAYAVGFIISAFSFVRQFFSLWRLQHEKARENWNGYPVIATEGKYPTFSFLGYIFYDNTNPLPEEEKQIILLHESVHLREFHSIDILILELLNILIWYNPLFRLFLTTAALNHEYLADCKVLATSGIAKATYKKSLAMNSLRASSLSIGTFFNKSQTLNRIEMMNQNPQPIKLTKVLTLALITCALTIAFSCENSEERLDSVAVEPAIANNLVSPEAGPSGEIFSVVEEQPDFQGGGNVAFLEYVGKNLRYPEELKENKLEGKVYVEFVIEKDGSVENVQVLKGIGGGADQEAVKVIKNSPRWSPGKHGGEPVRVRMVIPISFKLS